MRIILLCIHVLLYSLQSFQQQSVRCSLGVSAWMETNHHKSADLVRRHWSGENYFAYITMWHQRALKMLVSCWRGYVGHANKECSILEDPQRRLLTTIIRGNKHCTLWNWSEPLLCVNWEHDQIQFYWKLVSMWLTVATFLVTLHISMHSFSHLFQIYGIWPHLMCHYKLLQVLF